MARKHMLLLQVALSSLSLVGTSLPKSAAAQIVVAFPPPEYVATTTPVYFEGRAAYWYGDRWYYRTGNGWEFYRQEPPFLHDWRSHHEPPRRYFEGRREEAHREEIRHEEHHERVEEHRRR